MTPPTRPGRLKLSEIARHAKAPAGCVATGWPAVRDQCARFGVRFDDWQHGAGELIFAKRADGSYAASIGGVVISIPRQVGKTFLVGAIIFALCLLRPGLQVVWTAHHSATSGETFRTLKGFANRKKVAPHVLKVLEDDEWIEFKNGSRIMFGARERGFGRGFTNVGMLVFDEAQILSERALSDMVPTQNTAVDPLLFFMGTPPKPTDPSEVFTRKRSEVLAGEDADTAYIEFSADPGADPDDRKQWAKANPSYPKRTPDTAMQRMRKNLATDSFLREALGVWDELAAKDLGLVDPDEWADLRIDAAPAEGVQAFGVKFSADGDTVAVSVAVRVADEQTHVEGVFHRPMIDGTRWLVDWFATPERRKHPVVVDGKAHAGGFVRALEAAGVPKRRIVVPTVEQVIAAHSMFVQAVIDRRVTHIADEALDTSVLSAGRRPIGNQGGWGFISTGDGDVTLAESAVLACFGAANARKPRTTEGGRRAVML